MKSHRIVSLSFLMAGVAVTASAQLPQSRVLTLSVAQEIAQESMAKCKADGYKVTVLVVDALNAPKVMLRDDGVSASTTEAAKMMSVCPDSASGPSVKRSSQKLGLRKPSAPKKNRPMTITRMEIGFLKAVRIKRIKLKFQVSSFEIRVSGFIRSSGVWIQS